MTPNLFPKFISIAIPIKNENNLGKELYLKANKKEFKEKFRKINIFAGKNYLLPKGINWKENLEKIVQKKDKKFCELFGLK